MKLAQHSVPQSEDTYKHPAFVTLCRRPPPHIKAAISVPPSPLSMQIEARGRQMELFLNPLDSSHVSIWERARRKRLEKGEAKTRKATGRTFRRHVKVNDSDFRLPAEPGSQNSRLPVGALSDSRVFN